MDNNCCGTGQQFMLLACAGCSNVGQLSNQVAVELTQEGFGKLFYLAGIGAHLSGFTQSAKDVPDMVVIEGCSIGCAKKILEHVDIPVKRHVVITDLGIEKNKDLDLKKEDIQKIKDEIKKSTGVCSSPSGKDSSSCCR